MKSYASTLFFLLLLALMSLMSSYGSTAKVRLENNKELATMPQCPTERMDKATRD